MLDKFVPFLYTEIEKKKNTQLNYFKSGKYLCSYL